MKSAEKVAVKKKYYDEKGFKLSKADGKGPPLKPLYILEDKFKKEANFQNKKIKPSWKEWFLFFSTPHFLNFFFLLLELCLLAP